MRLPHSIVGVYFDAAEKFKDLLEDFASMHAYTLANFLDFLAQEALSFTYDLKYHAYCGTQLIVADTVHVGSHAASDR